MLRRGARLPTLRGGPRFRSWLRDLARARHRLSKFLLRAGQRPADGMKACPLGYMAGARRDRCSRCPQPNSTAKAAASMSMEKSIRVAAAVATDNARAGDSDSAGAPHFARSSRDGSHPAPRNPTASSQREAPSFHRSRLSATSPASPCLPPNTVPSSQSTAFYRRSPWLCPGPCWGGLC